MCKFMKQVIYFQGDGPCLGTWNKESKQYTWLSYNQVGSSIQVKPLVVNRRGGEETGGGEKPRRRGLHPPTPPTEVSCSVLLKPLVTSVVVTRYHLKRDMRSIYL